MNSFWFSYIYNPLHNLLAIILHTVPFGDVGLAVILMTLIVRVALFPLSKKSIVSQIKLRTLEPEINRIKQENSDKQIQAQKTFDLYKKEGVNPFSGCLLMILQIPIIIGLFRVFKQGLVFTPDSLYSFVSYPVPFRMEFLGFLDLSSKSIVLAILVGLSQFFVAKLTQPSNRNLVNQNTNQSFQEEFAKSMQFQMKYVFPLMMAFFSYVGTGVVALYFLTSNIVTFFQELYIRKQLGVK